MSRRAPLRASATRHPFDWMFLWSTLLKPLRAALSTALLASVPILDLGAQQRPARDSLEAIPDSAYGNPHLAAELSATNEPPLYRHENARSEVYRMVVLGPWGGAEVTRLHRRGRVWRVVRIITDNARPRRVRAADSAIVSSARARRVVSVIRASDYWRRSPQQCGIGHDGYTVVLEAAVEATYFTITCWEPNDTRAPELMRSIMAFVALGKAVLPSPATRTP